MIVDRSQQNLALLVRLLDDTGQYVPSIAYDHPSLVVGYKKPGFDWTDLTLVAGSVGANGGMTWGDSHWLEDSGGNGNYELGIPNSSYTPGRRTVWRFKVDANQYRFDAIDYVAIPSQGTETPQFNFGIPGAGPLFASDSASIYIREKGLQVIFTANQDITAIPLYIVFESGDNVDKYVIPDLQITKVGATATIDLPVGYTDTLGTLNWGIRHETTERVYGQGTLSVTYAPHKD